ncbi:MAG: chorismate synthase [Bifidobacteriaceae bacterium]|jgi:chorismate synthase|nr:chorismate synthase [Bifidobacteriaceae bacterium]
MIGKKIKWTTAGESHGKGLVASIEGIPAGLKINTTIISDALAARREGVARGARQKFEEDKIEILTGVYQGVTTGAPISIIIYNSEWPKWEAFMATDSNGEKDPMSLYSPRPGHADLEAIRKYDFETARFALERASARETAARVALGAVATTLLNEFNIIVTDKITQFYDVVNPTESDIKKVADWCSENGETVGGKVQTTVSNMPYGLGSFVSDDSRLESQLAGAIMSIQAVKAVEIGAGTEYASLPGSVAHDEIELIEAQKNNSSSSTLKRITNNAGGIEGGISNGEDLVVTATVKPIPSVPKALKTIDIRTGEPTQAHPQRSDASAVEPAAKVVNAEVALIVADAILDKFGGDSLNQTVSNFENYYKDRADYIKFYNELHS